MNTKKIMELKQERAGLLVLMRALDTEFDGIVMPAEKKSEFTIIENRMSEIDEIVIRGEKILAEERRMGEKKVDEELKPTDKEAEIRKAFMNYIQTGTQQAMSEYRALSMDAPTQAGYLVAPEKFVYELIADIADATFMRQKAKVLPPLTNAQSLGYPTRTAGMSSFAWGTEIASPTADAALAFGKREFKAKAGTSEILVSKTLIRNTPNADALVRGEIAREIAAAYETAYMTGLGVTGPLGVFVASADGIPTTRDVSTGNTATEIKFDGLIEAQEKVKQQYQAACEWVFHSDAVKQLRKLKDSDGQYVWQNSVQAGAPDLLFGKAVNRSEYAPKTFTTGLYVGLYGNLKYYWIVDSLAMEIQALMELYARTNQVDYITRIETDGAPVLPDAFSRVKLG